MSLYQTYTKTIIPELQKEFGIKNKYAAPSLEKVVVNIGLGRASQNPSFLDKMLPEIEKELAALTGQKPFRRPARISIAGFKLREGQVIGLKVTLRGSRMFDFIDKLNKIVFPRVRDFKGIDLKNIDAHGSLNLGLKEHVVFPEISQETSVVSFGLQITCTARHIRTREQAIELYKKLGFRFKGLIQESKPKAKDS
jgi:large subunit ribosomal protein L5